MRHLSSSAASRSAVVLLASSSLAICTWRLLQWRARKRAKNVAERARRMVAEGPLIDCTDESVKQRILNSAIRRASKWMSYQSAKVKPMTGQIGGMSQTKRPLLIMEPDYVMKPMHPDQRGYREAAFYEAVKIASQHGAGFNVAAAMAGTADATVGKKTPGSGRTGPVEVFDVLAMWVAICLRDSVVTESELTLMSSWKATRKEIDLLRRLSNFIPAYYGVVKQSVMPASPENAPTFASDIGGDCHLLLHDATANFYKPCAIDIKMGTQTYEPDAPDEKRTKEYTKYPQQSAFGLRIVGMRIYDPSHSEANEKGFRSFPKDFGTALVTKEDLLSALKTFFSAGAERSGSNAPQDSASTTNKLRIRVISNFLMQMRLLRRWFEDNDCLRFYASSLFLVYEGGTNHGGNQDVTSMKMIDFGHVRRDAGGDHGYKLGLRTLMSLLTTLLDEAKSECKNE